MSPLRRGDPEGCEAGKRVISAIHARLRESAPALEPAQRPKAVFALQYGCRCGSSAASRAGHPIVFATVGAPLISRSA